MKKMTVVLIGLLVATVAIPAAYAGGQHHQGQNYFKQPAFSYFESKEMMSRINAKKDIIERRLKELDCYGLRVEMSVTDGVSMTWYGQAIETGEVYDCFLFAKCKERVWVSYVIIVDNDVYRNKGYEYVPLEPLKIIAKKAWRLDDIFLKSETFKDEAIEKIFRDAADEQIEERRKKNEHLQKIADQLR